MATLSDRDSKLVQYLNEAYGKEKELEAALEAHIGMTSRTAYKKRLQQHLRETKDHARRVERRIKQLGGDSQTRQRLTGQATAALKGPMHALRGTGDDERLLKNAKTEYSEEAEEIATYSAIVAFADNVADRDTAKLARGFKREEERMANYLERLIPQLVRAVVRAEVPSDQRSNGRGRRRRSSSSSRSRGRAATQRSGSSSRRRSTTQSRSRSRTGSPRRPSRSGPAGSSSRPSSRRRSGSRSSR